MKKLFAILSLSAFLAVGAFAQSPATKSAPQPVKKEVKETKVVTKEEASTAKPAHSCCTKANAACCKNNKDAKACTSEQKAECAKAGASTKCSHDHAKAEKADEKSKTEKTE